MPLSNPVFATLLILSFLFNGAETQRWPKFWNSKEMIVIGYAAVSEREAMAINFDSQLWVKESSHNLQIGAGFYLVNTPGNWIKEEESDQEEETWFCVVKARKSKIRSAAKVYIPRTYDKLTPHRSEAFELRNLWAEDEAVIVEYISSEAYIKKPGEALRFSRIKGTQNSQLQMVIPTAVVNEDKLGTWARCFDSEEGLKQVHDVTVNWKAWKIKGDPGVDGYS